MGNLCGCGASAEKVANQELAQAKGGTGPPSAGWSLTWPPDGSGAVVTAVVPGGPASLANVQAGDVVLKLAGYSVRGPSGKQVYDELRGGWAAGQRIEIHLLRPTGGAAAEQITHMTIGGVPQPVHGVSDRPGWYEVGQQAARVSTELVVGQGTALADLQPGQRVAVQQLQRVAGRLRGLITQPVAGWFSILNLENGSRWARPVDPRPQFHGSIRHRIPIGESVGNGSQRGGTPRQPRTPRLSGGADAELGNPALIAKYSGKRYTWDLERLLHLNTTLRLVGGSLYVWGDVSPKEVEACIMDRDTQQMCSRSSVASHRSSLGSAWFRGN